MPDPLKSPIRDIRCAKCNARADATHNFCPSCGNSHWLLQDLLPTKIFVASMPEDEIRLVCERTGKVLGTITGVAI